MLTLVALAIILALLVLSNLSFDKGSNGGFAHKSYGWPLVWHRFVYFEHGHTIGWYWSASRLAGNVAAWLLMLVAMASANEWLLRRYRPRFRWSVRTMLAVTGLMAVSFAWFAAARERAELQDAIIDELKWLQPNVAVGRSGPRWLDLFGIDRFRRHIAFARLDEVLRGMNEPEVENLLKRVAQLRELQTLVLRVEQMTPAFADALNELPQLKNLSIQAGPRALENNQFSRECLAAIGKMTQLEHLELQGGKISSECLEYFNGLTKLRSLAITIVDTTDEGPPLLSSLPPFHELLALDLSGSQNRDLDLRRLVVFPRLKSLNLARTNVTDAGLAELAALDSLEELAISDSTGSDGITAEALESLLELNRLSVLHILREFLGQRMRAPPGVESVRIGGEEFCVLERDAERVRRLLQQLQRSMPGIVIDRKQSLIGMNRRDFAFPFDDYDANPDRNPSWFPASDVPWMTRAERAEFEQGGGWAVFDAAGLGKEQENSVSL